MAPPWAETQTKVVIEFVRGGKGVHRQIDFKHRPDVLPTQLQGRVHQQVWADLMNDLMELAKTHPYTQRPSAGRCMGWVAQCCMSFAIGFLCWNPDGGDYGVWLPQVQAVLERHRPVFAQAGCNLSMQHVHGSFWVQIDVDPKAMAMGQPVGPPAAYPPVYTPPPAGYQPPPPTGYPPPPAGYPPAQ